MEGIIMEQKYSESNHEQKVCRYSDYYIYDEETGIRKTLLHLAAKGRKTPRFRFIDLTERRDVKVIVILWDFFAYLDGLASLSTIIENVEKFHVNFLWLKKTIKCYWKKSSGKISLYTIWGAWFWCRQTLYDTFYEKRWTCSADDAKTVLTVYSGIFLVVGKCWPIAESCLMHWNPKE